MDKPRIFLGSSGKQEKLLQALTRGLEDVAQRRSLDDVLQSRDHHAGAPPRAHARSRLRGVRVRPGRLDDHRPAAASARARIRSGFSAGQRRLRGRPLRRSPRNAPNLHPPCERREASERSPRPHVRPVRRRDDRCRDESRQPEAPEGDRERGPRRPHRGPVVAVFPDGAQPAGAFGREPPADLARPRRRAGGESAAHGRRMARLSAQILERSGEGEEGSFGHLLLLEGRTAPGPERAAVGRDGGDPDRVRRSRGRVLHDSFGHGPEGERADVRCLPARRPGGHEHPGRTGRPATRAS